MTDQTVLIEQESKDRVAFEKWYANTFTKAARHFVHNQYCHQGWKAAREHYATVNWLDAVGIVKNANSNLDYKAALKIINALSAAGVNFKTNTKESSKNG